MSLNLVQGDTAPDIRAVLVEEDDPTQIIDLTDCTVRFQMRMQDDKRYQVNGAATILDEAGGAVSYSWGATDLARPGTFMTQWEVTYPGGRVQTTAREVQVTIRRQ